jgi:hypothetical protein
VIDVSSFDEKRTEQKRQPTHRVKSLNKQQKDELKETERKLSGNKQKKTI